MPARSFNFFKKKKRPTLAPLIPLATILFLHCPRFSPKALSVQLRLPLTPETASIKVTSDCLTQRTNPGSQPETPNTLKTANLLLHVLWPWVSGWTDLSPPSFPPHRCCTNALPSESLVSTKKPQTC